MKSRVLTVALLLFLLSIASPAIGQPLQQNGDHAVYLPLIMNNYHSDLINGDFESGSGVGWTEYSEYAIPGDPNFMPLIVDNTVAIPHAGSYLARFGVNFGITYIEQFVDISPEKPILTYWYKVDSTISDSEKCGQDIAYIQVNNNDVLLLNVCFENETNGWVINSIDLSSYSGQYVKLRFGMNIWNIEENFWYLDDISFTAAP